jgi:hypothetical protein
VVAFRGDGGYRDFLHELAGQVRMRRGVALRGRNELAIFALAELARSIGMEAPAPTPQRFDPARPEGPDPRATRGPSVPTVEPIGGVVGKPPVGPPGRSEPEPARSPAPGPPEALAALSGHDATGFQPSPALAAAIRAAAPPRARRQPEPKPKPKPEPAPTPAPAGSGEGKPYAWLLTYRDHSGRSHECVRVAPTSANAANRAARTVAGFSELIAATPMSEKQYRAAHGVRYRPFGRYAKH